jgi:hypothetical protein
MISLDRLAGGALLERFNLRMNQVGRNIMDPNTDPEKKRVITIKIVFIPDKSRQSMKTSVYTDVKLAPLVENDTLMLIGRDMRTGEICMTEHGIRGNSQSAAGITDRVYAEVVEEPETQGYDPDTGEIYEPENPDQEEPKGPVDLRKMR